MYDYISKWFRFYFFKIILCKFMDLNCYLSKYFIPLPGKYESFLTDKLKSIKDFIKKDLVGGLRSVVKGVEGLVPLKSVQSVVPVGDYYEALFQNSANAVDGLAEIAEATGKFILKVTTDLPQVYAHSMVGQTTKKLSCFSADALFNFPAYQSVRAWSSNAPAYLYSFEHLGNLTRGSHFLPGVALAG